MFGPSSTAEWTGYCSTVSTTVNGTVTEVLEYWGSEGNLFLFGSCWESEGLSEVFEVFLKYSGQDEEGATWPWPLPFALTREAVSGTETFKCNSAPPPPDGALHSRLGHLCPTAGQADLILFGIKPQEPLCSGAGAASDQPKTESEPSLWKDIHSSKQIKIITRNKDSNKSLSFAEMSSSSAQETNTQGGSGSSPEDRPGHGHVSVRSLLKLFTLLLVTHMFLPGSQRTRAQGPDLAPGPDVSYPCSILRQNQLRLRPLLVRLRNWQWRPPPSGPAALRNFRF